ncbi:hypothetical protein ACRAWF_41275 [Streptomyces sp. L7]
MGDYLSQPTGDGGLGLGTVVTSVLFLAVILGLVVFLTVTRKDVIDRRARRRGQAAWQQGERRSGSVRGRSTESDPAAVPHGSTTRLQGAWRRSREQARYPP